MDFFNVVRYSADKDPYRCLYLPLSEKAYPPLVYLLVYPFSKLFDYIGKTPGAARSTQYGLMSITVFLSFSSSALACLLYEMKKGGRVIRFLTVFALFASGISLFSLERGNLIYIAVINLAFFIMGYHSSKAVIRELSYVALAIAAAFKIYPALFGLLLLYERRYKDTARLALYGVITTFLPFLYFKGGFSNISLMVQNAKANSTAYLFNGRFDFVTQAIILGFSNETAVLVGQAAFVLIALAILTAWCLNKPWKTVMLLTCVIVALPVHSGYYCGLYFFIPAVMFLNEKRHSLKEWAILVMIILIFNPYQIAFHGTIVTSQLASLSVIAIYLLLLIEAMIALIRKIILYIGKRKGTGKLGGPSRRTISENT